jgi:hypothetical protein
MVKKYAIVKDGKVINVALSDDPLGDDWVLSEKVAIGDLYDGGKFTKPVQQQSEKSPKKDRIDALIDTLVFNGALSSDDAETLKAQR